MTIGAKNIGEAANEHHLNANVICKIEIEGSKYITLEKSEVDLGYMAKPTGGKSEPITVTANQMSPDEASKVTVKIKANYYANGVITNSQTVELTVSKT